MCLLTFLPAGVMPDTEALGNGALFNDDGHGFAIVAGDDLIVARGMRAETMIDVFGRARRKHPDGPALFHSRLSTHGTRSLANCHPFPVGGDQRTVVAHNGVLPAVVQPAKGDRRSDTRVAAEDFLPWFGSLRARRTRLQLERWMTPHNKMVILTVDRRFREPAYILNENAGIWHGGIWYSNDGYRPPLHQWQPADASLWQDWPNDHAGTDIVSCPCCQTLVDIAASECPCCGWCLDCGQMPEDCLCHTPALPDRPHRVQG